jgi:2-phospho-L-lactate transferase/gluconeogenesis factor (CofD/UPF0052 family)
VGPGTTYGSVLPNFLPNGMVDAYNKSKAKKILLMNIVATGNETSKATASVYLDIYKKYLKTANPFEMVVMADLEKLDRKLLKTVIHFYDLENSSIVKADRIVGIKMVKANIAKIEESNMRLRHSEEKLGEFFKTLEI